MLLLLYSFFLLLIPFLISVAFTVALLPSVNPLIVTIFEFSLKESGVTAPIPPAE